MGSYAYRLIPVSYDIGVILKMVVEPKRVGLEINTSQNMCTLLIMLRHWTVVRGNNVLQNIRSCCWNCYGCVCHSSISCVNV